MHKFHLATTCNNFISSLLVSQYTCTALW